VAESWSERVSILVVDDEFTIRSVVARALARQGYRVAMAANGREAVAMVEADQRYALVLLDVDMPEMTGLQALPLIRRAAPGVPVVYLSGHLNDDSAMGVMRSGADAVILKPFELTRPGSAYAGRFESTDLGTMTIAPDGSRLKVVAGECELDVVPAGPDAFKVLGPTFEGVVFKFVVSPDGEVTALGVDVPEVGMILFTR
jgi:CheY-like chemotaxis protein